MRIRTHMSINIAGLLKNYGKKRMTGLFTDGNGKNQTDKQVRKYLAECQQKGWVLLPLSAECEGFDHFGGGCPGHEINDKDEQTNTTNATA